MSPVSPARCGCQEANKTAVESRKKRREMVQGITGSLKDKDQTVERLQRHCLLLEAQ